MQDASREDLQAVGLRVTPTRVEVLRLLRAAEHSMTHQEIVRLLGGHGFEATTIYRSLIALVDAGLALRTDVGDHVWRFQAVREGDAQHEHPHFVCVECGGVECMPELEVKVPRGSRVPRSVSRQAVEVQVRGRCDNCS
ncbi:MAG: transcriptional repressor [Myxococcales bacterium]|nr:transcriptional repressor [Myxococcales bacterium]MCB9569066.1 transcriptional repressor [Myxococcales bacterium]MCB9701317.1 transcriptional repressor [Myxococcales bacterium]